MTTTTRASRPAMRIARAEQALDDARRLLMDEDADVWTVIAAHVATARARWEIEAGRGSSIRREAVAGLVDRMSEIVVDRLTEHVGDRPREQVEPEPHVPGVLEVA